MQVAGMVYWVQSLVVFFWKSWLTQVYGSAVRYDVCECMLVGGTTPSIVGGGLVCGMKQKIVVS
jgi:copper homeostasis protein CutC